MKNQRFVPDFLMTPYQLVADSRVQPLDEKVYSILYWFEHVRGDVNPANDEIARLVHAEDETGIRSVQNSLTVLEQLGYITRDFSDEARRKRKSITTNVSFRRIKIRPRAPAPVPSTPRPPALAMETKEETPGDFAKRFFGDDKAAMEEVFEWVCERAPKIPSAFVRAELDKFYLYWGEPTSTGKKQLWQTKPTFEVKRRVATWLGNIKTRAEKLGKSRRGVEV